MKKRITKLVKSILFILVVIFSFSCQSFDAYEWMQIFPNINFSDGFEKMNLAPTILNRENEVIARSLEGGIENSRFPQNWSDESYRWHQRSYIWKIVTHDTHECRITCWYISQGKDILIAWIEASLFVNGFQFDIPILFSPTTHKNTIISVLEQMYVETNNMQD